MRVPHTKPKKYDIPEGMIDGIGSMIDEINWTPITLDDILARMSPEEREKAEAFSRKLEELGGSTPEARAYFLEHIQDELEKE